jgi:hypothetical protein
MKSTTLLVLGMAGALACGGSYAGTYLCTTDAGDVSTLSCSKAPRDERAYGPAAEQPVVPSYSFLSSRQVAAVAAEHAAARETASAQRRSSPQPSLATGPARSRSDGTD